MRITDVTVELVDLPAQPPFHWRNGLPGSEHSVTGGILRIHTDDGLDGGAHPARPHRGRPRPASDPCGPAGPGPPRARASPASAVGSWTA